MSIHYLGWIDYQWSCKRSAHVCVRKWDLDGSTTRILHNITKSCSNLDIVGHMTHGVICSFSQRTFYKSSCSHETGHFRGQHHSNQLYASAYLYRDHHQLMHRPVYYAHADKQNRLGSVDLLRVLRTFVLRRMQGFKSDGRPKLYHFVRAGLQKYSIVTAVEIRWDHIGCKGRVNFAVSCHCVVANNKILKICLSFSILCLARRKLLGTQYRYRDP